MQSLSKHLDFRPHGDRLLTSSAGFWLFSARILVFAMATSEAVAWGYLGFILSDGPLRWLSAAFTGITIFLVVWMIDVSLITMDRAWPEHARAILGKQTEENRRVRDWMTFGLRIALLVGSLTITAPYLAQLVFYRDIQQFNEGLAAARIDSARTRLEQQFAQAEAQKARLIASAREAYEREIAGKGPSGRYGDGPTAQAMQRTVTSLETEGEGLARQRQREIARFDALTRNPELNRGQLATRYNLMIPTQTILGNNAVLQELRKRPEHQQTELAIKAFLAFIFAGLLLLKLFEPYSVKLYFSEVLQQEYDRYRAGAFDDALPPMERSSSTKGEIAPQRLYTFLATVWFPAEESQAKITAQLAAAAGAIEAVQRVRDTAGQELKRRKDEVTRLTTALDEAVLATTQLDSAIRAVEADVQSLEGEMKKIETRPETFNDREWREYRTAIARKLADAHRALRELKELHPTEMQKKERLDDELAKANKQLNESVGEVEAVETHLRKMRELLIDSSSQSARSILKVA